MTTWKKTIVTETSKTVNDSSFICSLATTGDNKNVNVVLYMNDGSTEYVAFTLDNSTLTTEEKSSLLAIVEKLKLDALNSGGFSSE